MWKKIALKWLFEVPRVDSHMELFLHTFANFSADIYIALTPCVSHLPCVCLKFSGGKTDKRKTPWKTPPCPEVVPVSTPDSYSPFSPAPAHTDQAHLIFSPLLMSNSCRVDSQGIAAITSSSPPSLPSFSQPFCVWPPNVRSLKSQNLMCKPSIHWRFIYDPGAGYDVMNLHHGAPMGGDE